MDEVDDLRSCDGTELSPVLLAYLPAIEVFPDDAHCPDTKLFVLHHCQQAACLQRSRSHIYLPSQWNTGEYEVSSAKCTSNFRSKLEGFYHFSLVKGF